ncbi:MAG TPA: DUF1835 domain-containing protein [Steroidobacteraceae bacterium]|nr:DUF1835 domain-containing protein [Steroidobacteraceae bacterium]
MTTRYGAFRLNFEQQQKRAKELLKAARAGDAAASVRFRNSPPKLAEAQFLIARELRFESWATLKWHIAAMTLEREAIGALDSDLHTLHIRCGSDLQTPLQEAGFRGDYYEHSYPYLIGPVREGVGCLEQRAHFIVDTYSDMFDAPLAYEGQLRELERSERVLHDCADYERVVIWSEGDCYDQLVLIRLLGHFAIHRRPPRLELINIGDFPGGKRFIGLGDLPPEALRMLWTTRKPAGSAQLQVGLNAWRALVNTDPRPLAALMHSATPALPLLAPALHRHLRELPSTLNGLSLTEQMALKLLAEQPHSLMKMIGRMVYVVDPLPGQGDWNTRRRVLDMEAASAPVFTRSPRQNHDGNARPPWTDTLVITELGRSVLRGEVDFRSLTPAARWVGGVEIAAGNLDWRWDEQLRDAGLNRP